MGNTKVFSGHSSLNFIFGVLLKKLFYLHENVVLQRSKWLSTLGDEYRRNLPLEIYKYFKIQKNRITKLSP